MKKVAVLMGGTSSEREVSLVSGKNVAEALAGLGKYDVVPVDLTADSLEALPPGVDAAYIALHGGWGENGGVQAALDKAEIPYTGPGALASQIAMDKVRTKLIAEMNGLPTAKWALAGRDADVSPVPLPAVVKPPCDGSSVGISKVSSAGEWAKARDLAFAAMGGGADGQETVLVEEFVPGREFTVGIVGEEPLPVLEIVARGGWYGYEEKYNSDETRYPFLEDAALSSKLQDIALKAYRATGCRGISRVDFRVSPLGRCAILEINTSPGLTSHSLVPKAAARAGMDFPSLCERVLSMARHD